MYQLTKEFTFDAAHMLDQHSGKCNNLHGHTYKLKVKVTSNELDKSISSNGMVIDFKDVKSIVKQLIDQMDHSFIYNSENINETEIANLLIKQGRKTFKLNFRSTCENMSKFIHNEISKHLPQFKIGIKLYETPTSYCYYTDEN